MGQSLLKTSAVWTFLSNDVAASDFSKSSLRSETTTLLHAALNGEVGVGRAGGAADGGRLHENMAGLGGL